MCSVSTPIVVVLLLAGACAHNGAASDHGVHLAGASGAVARGDCVEARRRAAARPDLDVDRLPAPRAMKPPLRPTALRKDGSAELKVDVIIDTLGRADMRTFRVVRASHQALADQARDVVAKWRFTPAVLAGCKVPRVYHLMASIPPRSGS